MLRFGRIARGAWLVTFAPAALLGIPLAAGGEDAGPAPRSRDAVPPMRLVPRVACRAPETLRLRHFEDRSAQLLCGRRVIVRISVPG